VRRLGGGTERRCGYRWRVGTPAGGVAEACRYVVPERDYIVIKGITDWADATKNDEWHAFCAAASARLAVDLIDSGVI
jgi:hypothetical protein